MNIKEFTELMKHRFRYKTLYHFTDMSSWQSINEHGLLSKQKLEDMNIFPSSPGGDEQSRSSDRANGIYDYVSLSFTPQSPMAYACREDGRHMNQIMISICPSVLLLDGTLICAELANNSSSHILPVEQGVGDLDYEVWLSDHGLKFADIKQRVDKMKRVEVLVRERVARDKLFDFWKVN